MKLLEYLKEPESKTPEQLAIEIGVHITTMHRYIRGERTPEQGIMQKLNIATDKRVMANDFY